MNLSPISVVVFSTALCAAVPAAAHDPELNQRIRTLGLDVGNAYACTPAEQRAVFSHQSHHLYDMVLHDHGPDAAYMYAVSVGVGSARDVETIDCEAMTAYWAELKTKIDMGAQE